MPAAEKWSERYPAIMGLWINWIKTGQKVKISAALCAMIRPPVSDPPDRSAAEKPQTAVRMCFICMRQQ
ncbi:hypothetical protein SY86_16100 [Erwinia tracheiphila]|uniref:Uncharacterized protein n=1 Tax=Erwinia tracheiphila TaxID=65700 RepID=A0A0M2KHB1_9GAMM|nr:hypothetical protein AV903_19355 [Erwinia tracheiphila]EOS93484.1 hypothetical protein ETR_18786 [Erwinia tracheiphila PSU-1]KKF36618.1 hypothetical protein SY86_16100 [Erwinia tracheiphila]